ncbi:hypothetical protein [Pedobacter foliorum]|uniref:pirin family protein n=1 Tax=Pedobacter foliorum TaxID=2739058 RepID=UPI0015670F78|nr:hypothetical protein [Pedobacter foliorum]NRF39803.1 hypothetical protein [Pedobacter foliorum]
MNPGKIFLNEQRGIEESSTSKTTMTFNSNSYYDEHKQPIRNLTALNDELLVPRGKLEVSVKEASHLLILPITGDLFYQGTSNDETEVNIGEVKICSFIADSRFTIHNPYDSDIINFLQIWIKDDSISQNEIPKPIRFDINKNINQIANIINKGTLQHSPFPFKVGIGQFGGRSETAYNLQNKNSTFFAFIIAGAFEINGRLMHPRDGLALWDVDSIEIEALSNEATLLCLELIS